MSAVTRVVECPLTWLRSCSALLSEFGSLRGSANRSRTSLDVLVLETVEQSMKLPSAVSEDRIQEQTAERIDESPVPRVFEELVEVSRVFRQDRIQQCFVEQTDETPDIDIAEKVVERPVTDARKDATGCEHACSDHGDFTVAVHRQGR